MFLLLCQECALLAVEGLFDEDHSQIAREHVAVHHGNIETKLQPDLSMPGGPETQQYRR